MQHISSQYRHCWRNLQNSATTTADIDDDDDDDDYSNCYYWYLQFL